MAAPIGIRGQFLLDDGETVEFAIQNAISYQQWGNDTRHLGACVDLIEALTEAASEHLTYTE